MPYIENWTEQPVNVKILTPSGQNEIKIPDFDRFHSDLDLGTALSGLRFPSPGQLTVMSNFSSLGNCLNVNFLPLF